MIDAVRDELKAPGRNDAVGVWPENLAIVTAFLAVATQWRALALGGGFVPARVLYLGLDYGGARVALDARALAVTPELWEGLQVMEAEAIKALNEDIGS
jgi:Phage related hypothetical protein (DUF1799)